MTAGRDPDDRIPGLLRVGIYMQAGCSASRAFDRAVVCDCGLPLDWAATYRGVSPRAIEMSLQESAEVLDLTDDPYYPEPDQAELTESGESND